MAWSPDGGHLAFVCGGDLHTIDVFGTTEAKLVIKRTPDRIASKDGAPALAPRIEGITCPNWLDIRTLIYQDFCNVFDGQWQYIYNIVRINSDGSGREVIIQNGQEPLVSPDGNSILYHMDDSLGGKIMVADVSGSEPQAISGLLDGDREPMTYSWSEDGKYVLLDGYSIDPVSGKQTPFAGELAPDPDTGPRGKSRQLPAFSPDGRWLMFSTPQGPKLVKMENGVFTYDSSKAYKPLVNYNHIIWIK